MEEREKTMRPSRLLLVLLLVLFMPAAVVGAVGENDAVTLSEADKEEPADAFQVTPFIEGQQTFVPLRELGRLMDFQVDWDPHKGEIRVFSDTVKMAALPLEDNELVVQVPGAESPVEFEHGDAFDDPKTPGVVPGLEAPGELEAPESPVTSDDLPLEEPFLWTYRKIDGHIYVPLRSMAELFSWRIGWDAEHWTVRVWTADAGQGNHPPALEFPVEQRIVDVEPEEPGVGATPGKVAYLTFDDGPSRNVTPRILDVLKKEKVPATFFVTGAHAKKHPDIIRRIHQEGHTIGNHTYSHVASVIYSSPQAFMREIRQTEEIIYEITGERTNILRAPYGSYPNLKAPFRKAIAESGYKYVDWNVNSMDTRSGTVPESTIVNAIKRQVPGKDTVNILFHDLPAKTTTAQALPQVISFLREQNYTFRPLTYDVDMITHW